jgi:hypothetical protein
MRQGGFPILKMSPRTDPVWGFSAAVTETAVIEQKNRQTGLSKTLGKWLKSECSFRRSYPSFQCPLMTRTGHPRRIGTSEIVQRHLRQIHRSIQC